MINPLNLKCGFKLIPLFLFIVLPILPFFQGCAVTPTEQPSAAKESAVIAKPLENPDKLLTVTELYQVPSRALSREQIQQQFRAIEALIQSGSFITAQKQADSIKPSDLSDQERSQLKLLIAQIRLSVGDAELAIENLEQVQLHLLSLEQRIIYLQSRAFALSLTGRLLDSAKTRIDLHTLLTSPEAQEQNQRAILETLAQLPDISSQHSGSQAADILSGWLKLAWIYKQKDQPDFNVLLNQWREAFPDHPADLTQLTQTSASLAENSLHYPGSIAIILPESGPFAGAGKAVKAGIMSAFDKLDSSGYKPNLHFYDSSQAAIVEHYHQAIAAGAELIIGPLEKKDIQSLADSVTLDVPVLALNHIQGLDQGNLYQFALSPLDDIEHITRKARQDGHKKALLLIPENPQTQRIAEYFKDYWQSGDSIILKTQTYHPKAADFSSAIEILLNRNNSKPLSSEQGSSATPIDSRKQDADVIFISAYPAEARTIKQQLNLQNAGDLAVYALPNVYAGQSNPDQVLNDIVFCDMPLFFKSAFQGTLTLDALTKLRRQFPDSYFRLIAMGIDAFNLSARLNELDSHPYAGVTGNLSLARDNRIKRGLICAKFINGQPRVTDFIHQHGKSKESLSPYPDPSSANEQDSNLNDEATE